MFERITDRGLKRRVKQHVIGRDHIFFVSVQPGFEKTISRELQSLGLNVSSEFIEGGVEFTGALDDCFTSCMSSRTASRVMMRMASFRAHDFYELERAIRAFPWELYLNPEIPVNFNITSRKSMIYHTGKLQEIFEKELSDAFRFSNDSEMEQEETLRQTLFIRNFRDICTVSIDASGEFLYKRGMKQITGRAPIRETLAALILLEADIAGYDLLLDPMCGSGTFSIEAASIFSKTLPNAERIFPFMNWPSFKEKNYLYLKKKLLEKQRPENMEKMIIITSDIEPEAVKLAESNIPEIFREAIVPEAADFF
jgi:putative N6-adenine-specific DNA methylase